MWLVSVELLSDRNQLLIKYQRLIGTNINADTKGGIAIVTQAGVRRVMTS
jgi:hypothetical protein